MCSNPTVCSKSTEKTLESPSALKNPIAPVKGKRNSDYFEILTAKRYTEIARLKIKKTKFRLSEVC